MNISGIQPYSGSYDYNSIKKAEPLSYPVQAITKVDATAGNSTHEQPKLSVSSEEAEKSQRFTAADYASQYQSDATYDGKGADSDIHSLDMTRAISDMQKDQVLQQYQFFIGESQAQGSTVSSGSDNMSSRALENFSL
jgi:hypothetical protein